MQQKQIVFREDPEIMEQLQHPRISKMPKAVMRSSLEPKQKQEVAAELQKEEIKTESLQEEKVMNLLGTTKTVLFSCQAIFPFDFFPDEISIEPTKINVVKNLFFFTKSVKSIPITNIAEAVVGTSPFFASLKILDQTFAENSIAVSFLNKDDAEKARSIIQGLIVLAKEGIDLSTLDPAVLKEQVVGLGTMQAIQK